MSETTQETAGPLYKAVEKILDEHSAWIARPSREVTERVAFAALVAAQTISAETKAAIERDPSLRCPDCPGVNAYPDLVAIVKRFVALPGGAWHPERHAAEEAELFTDACAVLSGLKAGA